MRGTPCTEVIPGLVWVHLCVRIHFVYSAPRRETADMGQGYLKLRTGCYVRSLVLPSALTGFSQDE